MAEGQGEGRSRKSDMVVFCVNCPSHDIHFYNSARTIPTGSSLGLTKIIITTLDIIHDTRGHSTCDVCVNMGHGAF